MSDKSIKLNSSGVLEEFYSGGGTLIDFKRNITLLGVKDGVNTVFTTPDLFVRTPFTETVYRNGDVQEEGIASDYAVSESVPGNGYDTITFDIAPRNWEKATIDYIKK